MTRQELATASEQLESAAAATSDDALTDRLGDLAGQLDTLADREETPDHGRLARIEFALDDVAESADDDLVADIDEAHEHVIAFRETVEGV